MGTPDRDSVGRRLEVWMVLALCAAVVVVRTVAQLTHGRPDSAKPFAPDWLALAAAGFAAAGVVRWNAWTRWPRTQRALLWAALLLMVWIANGLPFDLLRLPGLVGIHLMPPGIDWPGLATRALALAAAVVLAHLVLALPAGSTATRRPATWYGYVAFVLALPYPVLRTVWAMGGTLGLCKPGAAGPPIAWLACIPWLMAAALSLLLVSRRRWVPRWILLAGGWFATGVVALIGPAATWVVVSRLMADGTLGPGPVGIATWVFVLLYGSWLLWAVAAAAATRSYQLRTAGVRS